LCLSVLFLCKQTYVFNVAIIIIIKLKSVCMCFIQAFVATIRNETLTI
jgi:hypothetical protein